jgi:flagellar biosynthesis protein FlhG
LPDLLIRQNCDATQSFLSCSTIILVYSIKTSGYSHPTTRSRVGFHVGTHVAFTLAGTGHQQQNRWLNENGNSRGNRKMDLTEVKLGQRATTVVRTVAAPVRVIAVAGGKGGSGKTSVAVNLAWSLAEQGQRTLLLDADLGMANVDVLLGLETRHTLLDVMYRQYRLEEIILQVTSNLLVIPAASGASQLANLGARECAGLVRAFSDLKQPLDTLVIDTASGLSESAASFCRAATEVLVVITNAPAAIRDSVAQIRTLSMEYGIARFHILTNMVDSFAEGKSLFQELLGHFTDNHDCILSHAGSIPADEHMHKAALSYRPVVAASPRSRSAMALKNLARQASAWPLPAGASGHLEFFVERLIHNQNSAMEVIV